MSWDKDKATSVAWYDAVGVCETDVKFTKTNHLMMLYLPWIPWKTLVFCIEFDTQFVLANDTTCCLPLPKASMTSRGVDGSVRGSLVMRRWRLPLERVQTDRPPELQHSRLDIHAPARWCTREVAKSTTREDWRNRLVWFVMFEANTWCLSMFVELAWR